MFDTIFEFFQRLMGKERENTRTTARERLRLVLIHDRSSVSPQLMESLRADLLEVITRYMEIDSGNMELMLERHDGSVALAASIPVINIRRTPVPSAEPAKRIKESEPVDKSDAPKPVEAKPEEEIKAERTTTPPAAATVRSRRRKAAQSASAIAKKRVKKSSGKRKKNRP
ncbi:MAG: cell division topological specificity factor MinE [Chloroflexi bacterium]|nr:cell division topological specificity factor MinE [Chloroflexota bacterium]